MRYGDDSDALCRDHEQVIEQILDEEDKMIKSHRQLVDQQVQFLHEETALLNDVDQPASDIESYIEKLDKMYKKKQEAIGSLRKQYIEFYKYLKTEPQMSALYKQLQNEAMANMVPQGTPQAKRPTTTRASSGLVGQQFLFDDDGEEETGLDPESQEQEAMHEMDPEEMLLEEEDNQNLYGEEDVDDALLEDLM